MVRELSALIQAALAEDIGAGDLTTESTVSADAQCEGYVVAKEQGILSGIDVFKHALELTGATFGRWSALENGTAFSRGQHVASFTANTRAVLMGERVALNFLQRLSGVATLTDRFVTCVEGLPTRIVDTRKTTPGLRRFEKRAVQQGGGFNHRFGLSDGILIKENHIAAAGGIAVAVEKARARRHHLLRIEIEVRDLDEFDQAVAEEVDVVLLDNMTLEDMREAVARVTGTKIELEASGNVSLDRVRAIAETGVHYISVGALTHSAPAVDLSLLISNV